jgi:excinuclease UvrABC ATPase subunit
MARIANMASTSQHSADSHNRIRVQGAWENNLKDVSVEIPKQRLTVFTGVSGSGRTSWGGGLGSCQTPQSVI